MKSLVKADTFTNSPGRFFHYEPISMSSCSQKFNYTRSGGIFKRIEVNVILTGNLRRTKPGGERPFLNGHCLEVNAISLNLAQKGWMADFKNTGGFGPVALGFFKRLYNESFFQYFLVNLERVSVK
jgi:hypothetical protein